MRRTVIGFVLAAVLLLPGASAAAEDARVCPSSWWQALIQWAAQLIAIEESNAPDDPEPGLPEGESGPTQSNDARTIIDPNG